MKTKPRGVRVPPLSRNTIRGAASFFRDAFRVTSPRLDVIDILEFKLPAIGLHWDIREAGDLGQDHALTFPDRGTIFIREDVYNGACNEVGRDRFTICHEIGHLFLHNGVSSFARSAGPTIHKHYEDSEWQADTFSAEFLMPAELVVSLCRCIDDICRIFGVSEHSAQIRAATLRDEGKIFW